MANKNIKKSDFHVFRLGNNMPNTISNNRPPIEAVSASLIDTQKVYDTHGTLDTNKGTYTVPIDGVYNVSYSVKGGLTSYSQSRSAYYRAGDSINVTMFPTHNTFIFTNEKVFQVLRDNCTWQAAKILFGGK